MYTLSIKKFLTLLTLCVVTFTNAKSVNANCSNGECEFYYSNHYKYAKTYCLQTLIYEDVETNYLNFTISKTDEKCDVFETRNEK